MGNNIQHNHKSDLNDELNSYRLNFATNLQNSNLQIDNITLRDTLHDTISLRDVFDKGQKQMLVCRFSKWHCESCIEFSIQFLRKWKDRIGSENILFLGNHRNNRIFKREIPLYGIKHMKVFNAGTINIPVEKLNYPYYFILDNNLEISNVFIPDKGIPLITNKYLENVNNKF